MLKSLLIVYHSMTGGTRQMAEAALRGARQDAGVRATLLCAQDAQPEHVLAADGYLFATPENLASMSGLMKDFFDRTYYAALDQVNGRPYAAMVCAGSDGQGAIRQLERIALGLASQAGRAAAARDHPCTGTGRHPARQDHPGQRAAAL